jgi:dipeptidyl aminopeptidase/acylaminoacyl peptidase
MDRLMQIKHPSSPTASPDGKHVAFVWDEGGIWNLYLISTSGGTSAPVKLTTFPSGQVNDFFWSADGKAVLFPHAGELWRVDVANGKASSPARSTGIRGSGFALSRDGRQLAFAQSSKGQGAELLVAAIDGRSPKRIAGNDTSIGGVTWSPDGAHILYTGGARTIRHEQTPEYSGAKIIYTITERAGGNQFVVSASGGEPVQLQAPGGFGGARWVDSNHVVFDRTSKDFKKRSTYLADATNGSAHVIHEDSDKKFWSIPGGAGEGAQPSPNGKWISFLSDRDGWDHLYVMPAGGGEAVQITKGKFEAWRPVWSPDSKSIAFDANAPDHPGDRQLSIVALNDDPKRATIRTITSGKGTNVGPVWTADNSSIIYQHTDPQHSADLFAMTLKNESSPMRLTDSMGAGFDHGSFVEPEYVHFPGADGTPVPGWLFVPKNLDRSKKHPAVVWIHGDGVNQNYDGWHVQRNYAVYYSFHQYLLQQGYVVFAPDYRGSIGYGRDWREGVYMDVGGKDAKDAWMAGRYLKTLPYVDGERMGVWGLSYGGFFTLIAATDQPTLFRAAVDVAGVVDYRMYYEDPYHGGWTASRIGTPEENPKVYDNASPISHLDRLQRPLLVLHGTADINVPYLQSVRLIDSALKLHKGDLVDFMMYPGEFHYFDREPVLRDAWRRVDEFFRKNLMESRPASTN